MNQRTIRLSYLVDDLPFPCHNDKPTAASPPHYRCSCASHRPVCHCVAPPAHRVARRCATAQCSARYEGCSRGDPVDRIAGWNLMRRTRLTIITDLVEYFSPITSLKLELTSLFFLFLSPYFPSP